MIVVTGGTGFLGRALVSTLLGRGHDVAVVTRDPANARSPRRRPRRLLERPAGGRRGRRRRRQPRRGDDRPALDRRGEGANRREPGQRRRTGRSGAAGREEASGSSRQRLGRRLLRGPWERGADRGQRPRAPVSSPRRRWRGRRRPAAPRPRESASSSRGSASSSAKRAERSRRCSSPSASVSAARSAAESSGCRGSTATRSSRWIHGIHCFPLPSGPPRPRRNGRSIFESAPPSSPRTMPIRGQDEADPLGRGAARRLLPGHRRLGEEAGSRARSPRSAPRPRGPRRSRRPRR